MRGGGFRPNDTTYGNVCENVVSKTEKCWTAEGPVRHGHAPVQKNEVKGN